MEAEEAYPSQMKPTCGKGLATHTGVGCRGSSGLFWGTLFSPHLLGSSLPYSASDSETASRHFQAGPDGPLCFLFLSITLTPVITSAAEVLVETASGLRGVWIKPGLCVGLTEQEF